MCLFKFKAICLKNEKLFIVKNSIQFRVINFRSKLRHTGTYGVDLKYTTQPKASVQKLNKFSNEYFKF